MSQVSKKDVTGQLKVSHKSLKNMSQVSKKDVTGYRLLAEDMKDWEMALIEHHNG